MQFGFLKNKRALGTLASICESRRHESDCRRIILRNVHAKKTLSLSVIYNLYIIVAVQLPLFEFYHKPLKF